MAETKPVRPRTDSERLAYVTGYAAAINDTADHGLERASTFLREMVESEERLGTISKLGE